MRFEALIERQSRAVLVIALALALAGIAAALSLPIGLFPQVSFPRVVVDLDAGSRPADQTAMLVTRPVEDALRTIPGVTETRELFAKAFANGNRKRWRLNHSPLYLDFLEGKVDFDCTAWAIPSYSLKGWQRPCYLMEDGWVPTYKELIETTDWGAYGRGRDDRCANCMAHCGYEPTAVIATMGSLRETVRAAVGA